jgi:medium-chain acyl-[acyl-carrier-protein] hydrolase
MLHSSHGFEPTLHAPGPAATAAAERRLRRWIPALAEWRSETAAAVRLICLPHSGAQAATYRPWRSTAPSWLEVLAVEYPGHGARLREPPHPDIGPLVTELADAVGPLLDRPYALFGHSMGALVAYELAHRARELGLPPPVHLFVSGHRPPHLAEPEPDVHPLADAELVARLRALDGTPPDVLEEPELLRLVLPVLRADLQLCGTYAHTPRAALPCALTAFGGEDDPMVPRALLAGWREHAAGRFAVRVLPGHHFYLLDAHARVLAAIAAALDGWRAG